MKKIEMEYIEEALKLVDSLVMSDYEVTIKPVYATPDETRKRFSAARRCDRKHFEVIVGDKIESKIKE